MPGRTFNTGNYRFGFNGMENEPEINDGHKNTKFRRLDTRIGRWWSVDPAAEMYYSWSPYNLSMNSPLANSDPSGATIVIPYEQKTKNKETGEISIETKNYTYGSGDKMPKDKLLRQTVRTLDKIKKRGADRFGIIDYLSNHSEITTITPRKDWTERALAIDKFINWSPKGGGIGKDGKTPQSPALGLLHELAENYYMMADPEGKVAEYPELFKGMYDDPTYWERLTRSEMIQRKEAGEYQTYNDKWIIKEVEPAFNKVFKDENRNTHKGWGTKVWFGPFSKKASKYYDHTKQKIGKVKDLKKKK